MEMFFIGDQPMTCPRCGSRTEFDVLENERQHHRCLNTSCAFEFLAEPDDNADAIREANNG